MHGLKVLSFATKKKPAPRGDDEGLTGITDVSLHRLSLRFIQPTGGQCGARQKFQSAVVRAGREREPFPY